MKYQADFWQKIRNIVDEHEIVIDRKKGSVHPRRKDIVYPLDYGYLSDTTSMDGSGIDVWIGSSSEAKITGIMCTIDSFKKDSEIKIIMNCTESEIEIVNDFLNSRDGMKAIFIQNNSNVF